MSRDDATLYLSDHLPVETGPVGTEDWYIGYILDLVGDVATVGWDSGARGQIAIRHLRAAG